MTYVCWAALYEGPTDSAYFEVLIPRVMEELVRRHGTRLSTIPTAPAVLLSRGAPAEVASEACSAREAFHLCFVHADTGGRNLAAAIDERSTAYCAAMRAECNWPPARCIVVSPRKETEAWVLADGAAVTSALGYSDTPSSLGLPADAEAAERLADPKATLRAAMESVRGRRRPIATSDIFAAIAQRQSLTALRGASSFSAFENRLRAGLVSLGCVAAH